MLKKKGTRSIIFTSISLGIAASLILSNNMVTLAASQSSTTVNSVASTSELTLTDIPSNLKSSIEWVWNNRIIKENSTSRKNLIFDQIYAGKGTINYVVRWQSTKNITLQQRKDMAVMLERQINNWTKNLQGYEGWPYGVIKVKVVGWAVANSSQILDKQADEIVYTDYVTDDLSKTDSKIPAKLPVAPSSLSRFDHFQDAKYSYPGGLDKRFDMYLWGTSNFSGGAGGDWGQRISEDYILSTLKNNEVHIIEHEMGHGFGLPDFYEANERPPGGFPTNTIMWAGNSSTITSWDAWMLRYTWSQLKKDTSRFPTQSLTNNSKPVTDNNTIPTPTIDNTNMAANATVTSSYTSPWENVSALNDGFAPAHSNDRDHAVYGNWPKKGKQWVQYDFDTNKTISQVDLYWFKDYGGIDVPKSYKIKYWNGQSWVDVEKAVGLGIAVDKYNTTTFTPVDTKGIRIEMESKKNTSTGILEWKVGTASKSIYYYLGSMGKTIAFK